MSYIFAKISWFYNLAAYFYQFVIMFEAVFILTQLTQVHVLHVI